jgi:hypothetical protein
MRHYISNFRLGGTCINPIRHFNDNGRCYVNRILCSLYNGKCRSVLCYLCRICLNWCHELAASRSVFQEIPYCPLHPNEPEFSLYYLGEYATSPVLLLNLVHILITFTLRSILILPFSICLDHLSNHFLSSTVTRKVWKYSKLFYQT